jgi:hypothetical protein
MIMGKEFRKGNRNRIYGKLIKKGQATFLLGGYPKSSIIRYCFLHIMPRGVI